MTQAQIQNELDHSREQISALLGKLERNQQTGQHTDVESALAEYRRIETRILDICEASLWVVSEPGNILKD